MKKEKVETKESGYVYILTNPSFREDWVKIGKSSRPVNLRSKELDNTAVPLPFEIYATLKSSKYEKVEKKIHKAIDRLTTLRIRKSREFFNIEPKVALDLLRDEAELLDDAEIVLYKDNQPIIDTVEKRKKGKSTPPTQIRPPFKFSMVNIPVGTVITFNPTGLEVKVVDDNKIEYKGQKYKMSPFVREFLPKEQQNSSGAYQGPKYFSYKGKVLADLRREMEK
ncbi:MAG: GIY-YIG nuclease family protein [Spirochaetia bacterium]|nr:GIY-YIG nuclease family protein [Spirochaetia bacterium]